MYISVFAGLYNYNHGTLAEYSPGGGAWVINHQTESKEVDRASKLRKP